MRSREKKCVRGIERKKWEEGGRKRRAEGRESSRTRGGGGGEGESNESTGTGREGGLFIGNTSDRERAGKSQSERELVHISWDRIS